MAPVVEKHVIQQQDKNHTSSGSLLKEDNAGIGGVATNLGATQSFVLNHSHGHGHGHNHHHHHHHSHHQHAKENAASNRLIGSSSGSKKGLEILDFHESWREEVELYKDALYLKKHIPQQMLSSHNHAHTPQGCQLEMTNNVSAKKFSNVTKQHNNNINVEEFIAHAKSTTTSSISPTASGQTNSVAINFNINGIGGASNAKRGITNENKSGVRVAPTLAEASAAESFSVRNQVSYLFTLLNFCFSYYFVRQ